MPRKKKKKARNVPNPFEGIGQKTTQRIIAILLFLLAGFFVLSAIGSAGLLGNFTHNGLELLLGIGFVLVPVLLAVVALALIRDTETPEALVILGAVLFFLAGLGLVDIIFPGQAGLIGGFITMPLEALVDVYATILILGAVLVIATLLLLDAQDIIEMPSFNLAFWKRKEEEDEDDEYYEEDEDEEPYEDEEEYEDDYEEEEEKPRSKITSFMKKATQGAAPQFTHIGHSDSDYTPPPISLLAKDRGKASVGDTKANANIIKRTLANFNISVEMDEVSVGPTVTRYALKPAEGVRISRIVGLQNNLELALAAHPVRIEAPIPGKSLVGIEVPNTSKSTVGLANLIGAPEFAQSEKPLLTVLGRDITGTPHYTDIAKMPHLLIAGATGTGKSVMINTLITSLLYRNGPDTLRLIMVDPKRVELTLYNSIPHLLSPVITDAKRAIMALKWAVTEMDRRYDILEAESVRDIASYHQNVVAPAEENEDTEEEMPEPMPYIVVIIDELADLMQSFPRELEANIVRLAQMSRAVGIHLIISTQRPSVNVITGLIKANVPARIALQVASNIDSRTILDASGAEKLLGAGDLLYLSGEMSKPKRMQSPYLSESEVKKVVSHIAKNNEKDDVEVEFTAENTGDLANGEIGSGSDEDDLYDEAYEVVLGAGKASTSYLQRKLRVGYARAARLMDMLEERGIIGPQEGSKPREVLVSNEGDEEEEYEEDEE